VEQADRWVVENEADEAHEGNMAIAPNEHNFAVCDQLIAQFM
jgi:hypothetical protein